MDSTGADRLFCTTVALRRAKDSLSIHRVWNRELAYGDRLHDYYGSAYYNELVVPNRGFDAVGMAVSPGEEADLGITVNLLFHHDSPKRTPFGERAVQLMQLLFPALKAGVATYERLAMLRAEFVRAIDAAGQSVRLYTTGGAILHQSPALSYFTKNRS